MAGKFYQKVGNDYIDVTELCEPKRYTAAAGFDTAGTYFNEKTEFQKAYSNSAAAENVTLSYKVKNTAITTAKYGCCPTFSKCIHTLSSTGTHTIKRTDDTLTIDTSTYAPSDFNRTKIPEEFLFVMVGGGGGGGGCGFCKTGKSTYEPIPGGAGGGGGVVVAKIKLYTGTPYTLTVGAGGAAGSAGSSSSNSSGGDGVDGGDSGFPNGIRAIGGGGGFGGYVGGDKDYRYGRGGGGGYGSDGLSSLTAASMTGGDGGWVDSDNNGGTPYCSDTGTAGLSFTPLVDGASSSTICSSINRNGETYNIWASNKANMYSGGCSYGYGDYWQGVGMQSGGYGGGGTAGASASYASAGNAGFIKIYY